MMNDSKEQIQFALDKIEKQVGVLKCPMCGNTCNEKFFIEERVFHILSMTESSDIVREGQTASVQLNTPLNIIRALPITCKKCGHMLLFNLEMIRSIE